VYATAPTVRCSFTSSRRSRPPGSPLEPI
jgi:hypothetical protein